MVKKKSNVSLFSTFVQEINPEPSAAEYHLIDKEYFVAFNSPNDIEQFHNQLLEKQTMNTDREDDADDDHHPNQIDQDDNEMDMKAFAQQFLIDSPESMTTSSEISMDQSMKRKENTSISSNTEISSKRQRRNIRDLPQSSNYIFMADDDHGNIFNSLQEKRSSSSSSSSRPNRIAYEDISAILLTLDVKQKKKKHHNQEPIIAMELAEPSMIKREPTEQEHLVITHVTDAKEEPVELNVIPIGPMGFGTSEYVGDLDNYVQNIHRSCSTNVSILDSPISRPKRIRKRKRLYIEESETVVKPKRIRKKRPQLNIHSTTLTDAEIEQQFGERLSPTIKSEYTDEIQQNVSEIEPLPQTAIEKARAKLKNALERGHGPDTFLLKIRSRESKMIEVELAIYSTADWHSHRAKVLSKIEEALRGLRVSWTKIDIRVDDFDVQICTSPQTASATPSLSSTNANSLWFLKALSESGPLIVHIHDRRYPHQRHLIKCPCPHCSSNQQSIESSFPIIVSVSPAKTPTHRLTSPTILRKSHSSLHLLTSAFNTIPPIFFKHLVDQYGVNSTHSVTQCVLELTLIVSVHSSLSNLLTSNEEYQTKYQQIIDPCRSTMNNSENITVSKSFNEPDISTFYQSIQQHKANIRNAQSMRNVIFNNIPKSSLSNVIKTTTLILPKPPSHGRSVVMNRLNKRCNDQHNGVKQQAHFTPIIELKPILGGSTPMDDEPIRRVTKIISTNTIQKNSQRINTITTQEISPRVIRLSITKPTSTTSSIRFITPTFAQPMTCMNKTEISPLVPKQLNIIKPLTSSSSTTPAIKLSNPILISKKSQQSLIK